MNSIHANKMGSSRDRERSDDPKEKEHNKSGEVRSKRENKVEKRTSRKSKTPLRTVAFVPKFGGRFFRPYYKKEERFFQRPGHGFKLHRHHAATGVRFHRKGYTVPSGSPSQANQSDVKTGTHCTARTLEDQNDAQQTSKSTSRKKDVGSHSDTEGAAIHGKEIPLALKQTTMRSRAIQEKRREIEEVYRQDCDTFGTVARMLIAKDRSLERSIRSALRKNLREMGLYCVDAMEQFIKEYDSRDTPVSHPVHLDLPFITPSLSVTEPPPVKSHPTSSSLQFSALNLQGDSILTLEKMT